MRSTLLISPVCALLVGCAPAPPVSDDPTAVLDAFIVAPGYEVNLFAAEPMLKNPIQMAWDGEGRLWVVCSPTYPQLEPGQPLRDYIVVLEDTDNDGQADKHTMFADGLVVPTGIEFGDGGVYVANEPDLLFLADTDGDLVADVRRTVLSGFGTEDNHHGISAFVWGPGGKLYFQSGVFLHTQVETPHGVVRADDSVIFEFTPRKTLLERYVYGAGVNPWGHDFDAWGQDFQTDGAWEGIWWLAPGQVPFHARQRVPDTNTVISSAAGSEIVSGRHLPDDMQGVMVLNEFRGRTVERYRFTDDGAGYSATEITPPLLVSTEEYFRPVDVEMGPDGAIYVLDWYNALIGHMQYNFRDPRRDHSHGRVWRITATGRPVVPKAEISGASIEVLLDNLKAPEDYTRHKSRRELYERDPQQVADALVAWVAALDPNDPNYELQRLEALWTYQTIDVVEPDLLGAILQSEEPRARAAATRVLRYWWPEVPDALDLLDARISDDHPRVRLEVVVALSHIPSARSMELATRALDLPVDRHLEHALRLTANALQPEWLPAYEAGELRFNDDPEHVAFALEALNSEGGVGPLLDLLRAGQVPSSRLPDVLARVLEQGTPDALGEVFRLAFEQYEAPLLSEVLAGCTRAARQRGVVPTSGGDFSSSDVSQASALLRHDDDRVRQAAIRVVGAWGMERARGRLEDLASTGSGGDQTAAIASLGYLGGQRSVDYLDELAAEGNPEAVRAAAIGSLALLDLRLAATRTAEILTLRPDLDPEPVIRPFLERAGGTEALGAALSDLEIPEDVAKLALRQINASGQQEVTLVTALVRSAGFSDPVEELTASELSEMVAAVAAEGDAESGARRCFGAPSWAARAATRWPAAAAKSVRTWRRWAPRRRWTTSSNRSSRRTRSSRKTSRRWPSPPRTESSISASSRARTKTPSSFATRSETRSQSRRPSSAMCGRPAH